MTTLEYSGSEKALWDWGFTMESCQCQHSNLVASVYSGFIPGASVSDSPLFAFEGKVIIRRNRSGSGTSWSGGYVAFIGYAMSPRASHEATGSGIRYEFKNAWYLLENIPYQQLFASYTGAAVVGPPAYTASLEYKPLSDVVLFTKLNAFNVMESITSQTQITNIVDWANTQAVAASIATPIILSNSAPAINFPSYQVREIMCSDAIIKCLEMSPDVVTHWDYSTDIAGTPTPTLYLLDKAGRTSKTLAIANGTDHRSLNITPRYDLLLRGVVIQYKITGSADGNTWVLCGDAQKDNYGPGGAGTSPDGGLRVLLQTIDLQGAQTSTVSADLICDTVNAAHATDATRIAWWKKKIAWLNSDKINAASITIATGSVTVKDDTGATISLATYPRELTSGQVADWMGFVQKWVTITAQVDCDIYANSGGATGAVAGLKTRTPKLREISCRVIITDATTGHYAIDASYVGGESVPSGIAQAVWESCNGVSGTDLQYEGEDIRVQSQIMAAGGTAPFIHLGHKLNLSGGLSAWTTMNAQIQSLTESEGTGTTTISFGPAKHLSSGDLSALFQFNKYRRYWYNPKLRETANVTSSGASTLAKDVPKENSQTGSGGDTSFTVHAPE